jgi:hypothetical protein
VLPSSAITSINYKAAPRSDGLSAAIIKECYPVLKVRLIFIVRECVRLQIFPQAWKSSKVLIIGKPNKPSYHTLDSFRPISLVDNVAKVLEKIVLNRLQWHSSSANWLSPNQHGFTAGRSTDSARHALISFCEAEILNKRITACAFLDIKSAFDAAWHPTILSALARRGCPTYLVKLVSSFLLNRLALLSHNGSSASFTINLGCPQGGVLSFFLWSVLIDDVLRLHFEFPFSIVGYADDLTLATSHKDPAKATHNLQLMCNHVLNWCV